MGPYVEQGLRQSKSVALQNGSFSQTITASRSPGSARKTAKSEIATGAGREKRLSQRNMGIYSGMLIPLLLTAACATTWALTSAESTNITDSDLLYEDLSSEENEDSIDSRNDLDDLSDDVLRSFFDFTSTEGDNEDSTPEQINSTPNVPKTYSKHNYQQYYNGKSNYYAKKPYSPHYHGYPSSYHRPLPHFRRGQVTPGSHYKYETHKSIGNKMFDESKQYANSTQVVGPYQVSVVDAHSPLLSSLGLKRHHLEKLSGSPIPAATHSSRDLLTVSDSVPSASYAANPRQQHYDHGSYHRPPTSYNSDYDHSKEPYPPPPGAVPPPNYYHHHHHPQNQQHHHHNPPSHPPPQRSYLPPHPTYKEHSPSSGSANRPKYHYNSPSNAYSTQNSNDQWRPSSDGYDNEHPDERPKNNPNYNRGVWQQPSSSHPPHPPPLTDQSHSNTYSRPSSYGSSSSKPSSSSYPKYESPTYHKSPYSGSSSSSSTSKAPERAGSAGYDSYHSHHTAAAQSKPSITVRFKTKAPHGGISIPFNFNPLEVVKKLAVPLASLNPLANKKVTIGITIENKHQHSEPYHSHHY